MPAKMRIEVARIDEQRRLYLLPLPYIHVLRLRS